MWKSGAGDDAPRTFLRVLGPAPYRVAYAQPSRRPADGRYGENPNRLYKHLQFQVVLKPSPVDVQDIYLKSPGPRSESTSRSMTFASRRTIGNRRRWAPGGSVGKSCSTGWRLPSSPTSSRAVEIDLDPISVELTYGLERICAFLQGVESVYDLRWSEDKSYGDIRLAEEQQFSVYSFDRSDAAAIRSEFELHEKQAKELLEGFPGSGREGAGSLPGASRV